jgi:hypothetical protein
MNSTKAWDLTGIQNAGLFIIRTKGDIELNKTADGL